MADFRTANDVRNRTLTSQTIYANVIDANKIFGTIEGGASGIIIDSSTDIIINASELISINSSTVIVNSIQTCINASDEIKLICSGVILMTTNSLTMNIADLFDITTGQLAIDITGLGTINSSSLVVNATQMSVNATQITVNASNDLNLISSGNLVISGSLTINNQLIDDEIVLLNASQVLTNKDLTSPTNILPLSRWLRITETASQAFSSVSDVAVTFGTSAASTPTVGTLAANVVTFNGTYRLLVTASYSGGNAPATTTQQLVIRHQLNDVNIPNTTLVAVVVGAGGFQYMVASFVIDVVDGNTFRVRVDSASDDTRFITNIANAPCKAVTFTQI